MMVASTGYSDQTYLDLGYLKTISDSLLCGNLGILFLTHANF